MAGTATYRGSKTLGACIPIALTAQASLAASLQLVLPELTGKLKAYLNISAALSVRLPSLDLQIQAALKIVAQLQAMLTISGPVISLQLSVVGGLIAELNLKLGQINAMLALSVSIGVALGAPGIELYTYEGTADSLPSALSPEFVLGLRIGGGPNLPIHAVLLVATDSGAWNAMKLVLATG